MYTLTEGHTGTHTCTQVHIHTGSWRLTLTQVHAHRGMCSHMYSSIEGVHCRRWIHKGLGSQVHKSRYNHNYMHRIHSGGYKHRVTHSTLHQHTVTHTNMHIHIFLPLPIIPSLAQPQSNKLVCDHSPHVCAHVNICVHSLKAMCQTSSQPILF